MTIMIFICLFGWLCNGLILFGYGEQIKLPPNSPLMVTALIACIVVPFVLTGVYIHDEYL